MRKLFVLLILIALLLLGLTFKSFFPVVREHAFPSSPNSILLEPRIEDQYLNISYKWVGYKEASTIKNYLVVRYNPEEIQLDNKGFDLSQPKDFLDLIKYLKGDYRPPASSDLVKELIIPLSPKELEETISIPIEELLRGKIDITIHYFHVVALPMDMPSGWIKSIGFACFID